MGLGLERRQGERSGGKAEGSEQWRAGGKGTREGGRRRTNVMSTEKVKRGAKNNRGSTGQQRGTRRQQANRRHGQVQKGGYFLPAGRCSPSTPCFSCILRSAASSSFSDACNNKMDGGGAGVNAGSRGGMCGWVPGGGATPPTWCHQCTCGAVRPHSGRDMGEYATGSRCSSSRCLSYPAVAPAAS